MTPIRAARPEDADGIAAIYARHVLGGVATFETEPPDAAEIARRMAGGERRYPWLVAEAGGLVGYAHAGPFHPRAAYRWTAETSIYLAEGAQGRGVGRRLYQALIAALEAAGYTEAIARIALPHPASERLHAATGFRAVGITKRVGWKHARWIDVGLWQRALAIPADAPAEPRTWNGALPVRSDLAYPPR